MSSFPNCEPRFEKRVRRQVVGRAQRFLAVVQPGFEQTAVKELEGCGTLTIDGTVTGGVEFTCRLEECYRLHLYCRTVNRILMRISEFPVLNSRQLARHISEVPWELYLADNTPVYFKTATHKSWLYHSEKIEDVFKDGITQRLRNASLTAAFMDRDAGGEGQAVFIRIEHDRCLVSLDCSGELLYKRGQDTAVVSATLRGTTAAAILKEARFSEYDILIDPMCGGGTFTLEAAGMVNNDRTRFDRTFAFMQWPSFKPDQYNHYKNNSITDRRITGKELRIYTSDSDDRAVATVTENLKGLKQLSGITVQKRDFFTSPWKAGDSGKSLLVINPPYGKRARVDNVERLYREIGDTVRRHYPSSGFAIIVPGTKYEHALSLPYDRKVLFMNGGIRAAVLLKDGLA